MIDPDILAIQRRRRQEGRCIECARHVERPNGRPSVLCVACRNTLAYCPVCEVLYPRRPGLDRRRASEYCVACKAAYQRGCGGHVPYACYLASIQAKRHAILPELIKRYKKGQTLSEMGRALGLSRNRVERLIRSARERGEWPAGLWRSRHKEKAHG